MIAAAFVVAFATVAYFYRLHDVPGGYFIDTGGVLLNAECLAKTGTDEYGARYPLLFIRSFGDCKAPAYTYVVSALERLGQVTFFEMRIVSATLGFAAVVALLVFVWRGRLVPDLKRPWLYAIAFCLFVLSPWVHVLHRFPTEVSLVNLLLVANVASFWAMLQTGRLEYAVLNGLSVGIGGYCYQSLKFMCLMHPLVLGLAFERDRRHGRAKSLRLGAVSVGVALLLAGPLLADMAAGGDSMSRFRRLGGYNDTWMGRISRYFVHMNPNFLFLTGDPNLRHHDGVLGELALGLLPLLVCGSVLAWRRLKGRDGFWTYVLAMAALGMAPGCLSGEVPQAIHTNAATVPFFLLSLLGVGALDAYLDAPAAWQSRWPALASMTAFALLSAFALGYHLHWYYGEGYARASQNAWRSYHDIAGDADAPTAQVAPSDHATKSVFVRAMKVAAGDLDYCNVRR